MSADRGRTRLLLALALALAAVTVAVYGASLRNAFIDAYDDPDYVTNNPMVLRGPTWAGIVWALTRWHSANWHPLTWISHMIDCRIWGLDPWGHHLTSLLLHAADAALLLVLLDRMTGRTLRSAFVAALFALHPVHVESVAWVSERKDVLSTLFWLLATLAYVAWVRKRGRWRYALLVVLYALGLMAKPMLVTLPFSLLLLDFWPLGRLEGRAGGAALRRLGRELVVEKVPLLALAAVSCVITYAVQLEAGAVTFLASLPLGTRVANALVSYLRYIGLVVWPVDLAVLYPYPSDGVPAWKAAAAAALLAAATAGSLRLARRRPYVVTGWLWYLGTLVPVLGLVQVGLQSMADRYTYVPAIGLFVLAAWGIPDLLGRFPSPVRARILAVASAAVLIPLALATRSQAAYWRDSETLFAHTIAVTPPNADAHYDLGAALARRGRMDEAMAHYREAVRIDPGHAAAWNSLGGALLKQGKPLDALGPISEALRIDPRYAKALYNLGLALRSLHRTEEAAARYREALALDPRYAEASYSLAVILFEQGRDDEAEARFRDALASNPDLGDVRLGLGMVLVRRGKLDEAAAQLGEAARLHPDDGRVQLQLALLAYRLGDYARAWERAQAAIAAGAQVPEPFLEEIEAKRAPAR